MFVKDVLFLILEELKDDRKSLHSCLFVNKTWCEIIVPILWKIPGKYTLTNNAKNALFNVILLHLSEESRNILKNNGINPFIEEYRRLLFNYISFWRYLNLFLLESMIVSIKNIEKYNISIIRKEVLKLFINKNTKYIYLDIPEQFSYQLHQIPGAEYCFSKLECLHCDDNTDQNIFKGLARISKSIKKLKFYIMQCNNNDNSGIIKLIEAQKKLVDVHLVYFYTNMRNEPYCKTLEESLIKNSDTIQYLRIGWKPTTKILTSLVNLISLDINLNLLGNTNWNHLGKASLPLLKYLRAQQVPSKILTRLIENTKGYLIEISILYEGTDNRELIRAIYHNCQNLKYLKLSFNNDNISELENLLIKCQYLNGLVIFTDEINEPDWDDLFEILTKSSPISLYKFKLSFIWSFKLLESLKLFFKGWESRHPMLLHTIPIDKYYTNIKQPLQQLQQQMENLIRKYEARGIIKKYDTDLYESIFEEFEWIQKKLLFV
ncbi:uncharacterized protein OCT59_027139 [Rhizophagus irregularis]|uniref:F-box domain-containing protein n=4 Tax=Rhizophagus irregularis TaxID=588596 RepID=A0A015M6L1_RHIIW|nr:hypothetical protein GLOIN_2v761419 [Rhizophagus irregularis DAOM 181602=DAOM 197198]EXX62478.1 hypothetical protein RirG_161340 [Rhizophagus irregularis DAOM 197198w]POG60606.1 hypothetical protein GLOIN_2v761419 [Rhizophagus irregularis DAOM 181602=DAOM 197198]UZO06832.1 hypothetical protein OCT59_027139 [Rhizophagus irregularis]|eukprot:XP_025167472.1 hypothetical protein GLOIN_2v761419 [Rhizophagus irregularis DAOM 181602=DAOM 197198]